MAPSLLLLIFQELLYHKAFLPEIKFLPPHNILVVRSKPPHSVLFRAAEGSRKLYVPGWYKLKDIKQIL